MMLPMYFRWRLMEIFMLVEVQQVQIFLAHSAGTIHSTNQGGIDGFVSIITNNGNAIIRSTYVGTAATDQVYGVQFDKFGFPICVDKQEEIGQ